MEPRRQNILIIMMVLLGLVLTQGCGSSNNSFPFDNYTNSGDSGGVTITNEVSSPADMGVGDIIMAQFGLSESAEFDFAGVDEGSKYFLSIGSLSYNFTSSGVTIESSISDLNTKAFGSVDSVDRWTEWTAIDAFHQRLDNLGVALAFDNDVAIAEKEDVLLGKSAVIGEKIAVGDTEEFRVLNSLTSMNSYATVTARARCVKDNVILYVDTEVEIVNPEDLEDVDIEMLCDNFNEQVLFERNTFGNDSDVNEDGKVAALLTPQVNRLGATGGGIITGFFIASDLYGRSDSNAISNEREIVYALVPDSSGNYGIIIPKTFAIDSLLTAVLPHEFQHVISYNKHVFEGSGSPEQSWLNEGLSHLTEDLVGYGQENYSRINVYFMSPDSYPLVSAGSPNLGERGASYLLMRFLYEQHPDPMTFLKNLYNSDVGVVNLEKAFAGTSADFDQFGEFFMRWMTAVTMTSRGISSDTRYVYNSRVYNSATERWQGVCLVCDADDGRGTVLTGPSIAPYTGSEFETFYSSTLSVYDVSSVPSYISLSAGSGTLGAVLVRYE